MQPNENPRVIRFLGDNQVTVLLGSQETGGAYCILEALVQPRGGATALHTDKWIESFHVIEGQVEWTVERNGELVTWFGGPGETVVIPAGARHKWAGAGTAPSRLLAIGTGELELFFRALADAWQGPYDRERTPQAVGPVFERFGMKLAPRS